MENQILTVAQAFEQILPYFLFFILVKTKKLK